MNTANKLTIARIFLVFPTLFFIFCEVVPYRWIWVFGIFMAACVTDYLDGKIARDNNYVTDFGKIMDPLADKILVISMYICFVGMHFSPILPVVLIVIREFAITSVRFLMVEKRRKVVGANTFGKLKTFSQMVAIYSVILWQMYIEMFGNDGTMMFNVCSGILIWISCVFSLVSGVIYLYQSKEILLSE